MIKPTLRFKADDGSEYPEWSNGELGSVAFITMGQSPESSSYNTVGEGKPLVQGNADMCERKTCPTRFTRQVTKLAYEGDIIISVRAPVGLVGRADRDICCGRGVAAVRVKPGYDQEFLYQLFQRIERTWDSVAQGGTFTAISRNDISGRGIVVPSLPEQRKIVALLSSVDDVIAAQTAEVAAWEERKKGVMQKLFSQEVRFKDDDGSEYPAWEKMSYADTFVGLNNNTFSRDYLNYEGGPAKNIHYGDVLVKYGACVDVRNADVPFVNDDAAWDKYDKLQDGDVVIADTAEDDTVGKAVEVECVGDLNVVSGLHTIACRPQREFSRHFLGYYLNSDAFHDQLRPFMQGIKVTSISKTNIALTSIIIPSLSEQRKIADCLSSLDEVIAKAKDELAKWRELKKGLLQQMFV
ncbi:restriction endonuclease subunit S [Bifidobacterium samirii]|uniref:Restriction endonuclease S subunit n=1 Tax=Bifidobacterium samirii TaxID=2306974 RepID=A0A430FVI2_9BIFI|nr:restriction endonuclease subunit S [Bifidobacterium samirii]RSX57795.1 restriction endonuclease S subunit [Bifidobacterium samirii]